MVIYAQKLVSLIAPKNLGPICIHNFTDFLNMMLFYGMQISLLCT